MSNRYVALKSAPSITKDKIFLKEIRQTLMNQSFNDFRKARKNGFSTVICQTVCSSRIM